ncbi:MAG: hypothetical protein ACRC0G_07750 [Fusobacteriaceae bacterium]
MPGVVDLKKAIRITPTTRKPYVQLKGQIGGPTCTHVEFVTLERCISMLKSGHSISKVSDAGVKTVLTVENIMDPMSGVSGDAVEAIHVKDGKLVDPVTPVAIKEEVETPIAVSPKGKK